MESNRVQPHGGSLVNLIVDPERAQVLKSLTMEMPALTLSARQLSDLELLMNGAFSPLTGFLTRPDYESVVDRMRLQDGTLWPIPICLDISEAQAGQLETGQSVALLDAEGFMLAMMHVEDIWSADKPAEALAVYGTTDTGHPGGRPPAQPHREPLPRRPHRRCPGPPSFRLPPTSAHTGGDPRAL